MKHENKLKIGTVKFSVAVVILTGLIALCILKPNDIVASEDIIYTKGSSDIGFSRLIWNNENYIVDDNTSIIYKENDDLSISLYFTDETENYVYSYNKNRNSIEKLELY